MEGKDVKGLMEAYSKVNEISVIDEELVVVQDILGEDVEILDEVLKGPDGKPLPVSDAVRKKVANDQAYAAKAAEYKKRTGGSDYTAFRQGGGEAALKDKVAKSTPFAVKRDGTRVEVPGNTQLIAKRIEKAGTSAANSPATSASQAEKDAAAEKIFKLKPGSLNKKEEPAKKSTTAPAAAAKPKPVSQTVLAKKGGVEGKLDKATGKFTAGNFSDAEKSRYNKVAGQKKDAATNAKYQELRKTDPAKAKEFGMKANQAKFGKDFAKPKTPNPLMKDMPGQNKAELERVRGNAAIDSISKSPNAKKILSGTAKSASANKIGQASLNRSEFGSATKPKPIAPNPASVSGTFKPVPGAPTKSAANTKFKPLKEDVMDIFDIIKGHLLDVGYADSEVSDMVMITYMSEEWRDEIVERYKGKHGQSSDEYKRDRSPGGKMVSGDDKQSGAEYTHGRRVKAANPGSQPDEGGKTKSKSQGKMDKGTRADLEYRKANLKKEETEYVDENRRAARSAGSYKDDSEGQPDPSKDGFTGIGKMSIKDIMALNKKIEAHKAKKEETQVEGEQIDEVLGGQAGDGYIGHPRLGIKNPMAKKQTPTKTSSNTGIAGKLGNRAAALDAAMGK